VVYQYVYSLVDSYSINDLPMMSTEFLSLTFDRLMGCLT